MLECKVKDFYLPGGTNELVVFEIHRNLSDLIFIFNCVFNNFLSL